MHIIFTKQQAGDSPYVPGEETKTWGGDMPNVTTDSTSASGEHH